MAHVRTYICCFTILFWFLTSFSNFKKNRAGDEVKEKSAFFDPGDYAFVIPSEPLSASVPFNRVGNLIVIKATVDTISGNFILDTGAPGLILNMTYFRDYPHDNRRSFSPKGITGDMVTGVPTLVPKFSIGSFEYSVVRADRVNLGHLENSKGIKIMGLIGVGLFRRFEMVIDHKNELIHLRRFGKKEKQTEPHPVLKDKSKLVVHPIASLYGKMVTEVTIGNNNLSFVLDTGAEINVVDDRLPKKVLKNVTVEKRISVIGAGAKKTEAWYGTLKHLSVGGATAGNIDVMLTSLQHLSDAYGRSIDGILGYSFLSSKVAGINFAKNELYVWK